MKYTVVFVLLNVVGCKSTEKGFTEQELKTYEMQRAMPTWNHLSDSELAMVVLATICYKTYLVLQKYDYQIVSVSEKEIVYYQPNHAKITHKSDRACPASIHQINGM